MKKNRYPFIISLSVWPISSLLAIACIGRIRGCSGPNEWTPDLIRIGILTGLIVWLYFLMETFSQTPESCRGRVRSLTPVRPKNSSIKILAESSSDDIKNGGLKAANELLIY